MRSEKIRFFGLLSAESRVLETSFGVAAFERPFDADMAQAVTQVPWVTLEHVTALRTLWPLMAVDPDCPSLTEVDGRDMIMSRAIDMDLYIEVRERFKDDPKAAGDYFIGTLDVFRAKPGAVLSDLSFAEVHRDGTATMYGRGLRPLPGLPRGRAA